MGKPTWAGVARLGAMGDNLMATSVLPGLRARYGHVEVITRPPAGVIFENNPFIDKLTVWPEKDEPEGGAFWGRLMQRRHSEYDFFVHLSQSCEMTLAFVEAQSQFWWSDKMRRQLADHSYLGYIHDICDLPHDFAPGFYPTEDEVIKAAETLAKLQAIRNGPFVGWCISGSRLDKVYPGAIPVIIRLLEMGANVCMFGAPGKEFLMAKEIEKQIIMQTGKDDRGSAEGLYLMMSDNWEKPNWPIRRSLTQLQMCDLVITPDSGPAWSIAMLPHLPKIVLLSHASAKNIVTGWQNTVSLHADIVSVPCWPCHRLHDRWDTCNKHKDLDAAACMADIPIKLVVNMAKHMLGGGSVGYLADNSRVTWA